MLNPAMAVINFVSPWLAWGAVGAIGLPLLAHLLSKTRYRPVVFPAARLVRQAVAATSRIETPRHRLLMLLRWLILLLLVFAFMRPQWSPDAEASQADGGVALILLVDSSASMQRTIDGVTLHGRALRQAQRLIDQLDPSTDVAAVVRVDHASAALLPEPTAQFALLGDRLAAMRPGYTHADWASASAACQRLVADATRRVRLVTISDQQGAAPAFAWLNDAWPNARVDHLRIDGPTDNTAVRLLDVRPYPSIVGQPTSVAAEVRSFGDRATDATAIFELGSVRVERQIVLRPGAVERVEVRLPASVSASALLRVSLIAPDAIEADNAAGAWLPVQARPTVLVVHDATDASRALAQRLSLVLNPGEIDGASLPDVQTATLDAATQRLADADPGVLRTVVLLNREPLGDALSQSIEAFAQSGGGVVRFVMDDAAASTTQTTAAGIDFDIEPLRVFEGSSRGALRELIWPGVSNDLIDERAEAILMDDLERVIVASMSRGRGRLIAINASLRDGPGGLLAEPAFVVLFNELCRYASPGLALPASPRPGDALPEALRNAAELRVPDAARASGSPITEAFSAPGPYAAISGDGVAREVVFVALDPGESDTRAASPWRSTDSTDADDVAGDSHAAGDTIAAGLRRDAVELWPYAVLAMLGLVACESLLLWRFAGPSACATGGGL